jgi:hypothetical protein
MKGILLTAMSVLLFACTSVDAPADDALEPSAAEEPDPIAGDDPAFAAASSACGSTPIYRYTCQANCWYHVRIGACGGRGYYWLCDRRVQWKMADSLDVLESQSYVETCSQTNNCPSTCN